MDLQRDGELDLGGERLTFDVTDIDATKAYLDQKGVKTTEITDIPKMVSMFDSEGNTIQFVEEPRIKN